MEGMALVEWDEKERNLSNGRANLRKIMDSNKMAQNICVFNGAELDMVGGLSNKSYQLFIIFLRSGLVKPFP
jgi:hypothetical protein